MKVIALSILLLTSYLCCSEKVQKSSFKKRVRHIFELAKAGKGYEDFDLKILDEILCSLNIFVGYGKSLYSHELNLLAGLADKIDSILSERDYLILRMFRRYSCLYDRLSSGTSRSFDVVSPNFCKGEVCSDEDVLVNRFECIRKKFLRSINEVMALVQAIKKKKLDSDDTIEMFGYELIKIVTFYYDKINPFVEATKVEVADVMKVHRIKCGKFKKYKTPRESCAVM
ncbi:hypothetical protein ACFLY6_00645 [Candidatus Dependentiae bacterium]